MAWHQANQYKTPSLNEQQKTGQGHKEFGLAEGEVERQSGRCHQPGQQLEQKN